MMPSPFEVVVFACMAVAPDRCDGPQPVQIAGSIMDCLAIAPDSIADWTAAHGDRVVRRWICRQVKEARR